MSLRDLRSYSNPNRKIKTQNRQNQSKSITSEIKVTPSKQSFLKITIQKNITCNFLKIKKTKCKNWKFPQLKSRIKYHKVFIRKYFCQRRILRRIFKNFSVQNYKSLICVSIVENCRLRWFIWIVGMLSSVKNALIKSAIK